ncbi:MAG: class I adenylate-forming enzyme family protein [Oricola sp.]
MASSEENRAFDAAFAAFPARIATVTPDGQAVTYESYHRTVRSFTARLRASGIGPGAVVAPFSENPAVFGALVIALFRVGATVACVSNPDIAFGQGLRVDYAITLPDRLSICASNILFDQSWFGQAGDDSLGPDGRVILSSSGTTGEPKYYLCEQAILRDWSGRRGAGYEVRDADTLTTAPVYSGYGLTRILHTILNGGAMFRPRESAAETLRALRPQQDLNIITTPAMLSDFVAAVEAGAPLPARLRGVLLGGSPVSRQFAQRAEAVMGCPVYNTYGAIETGTSAITRLAGSPVEHGLLGKPLPGVEMRFEDGDGVPVADGVEGILAIRVAQAGRVTEALVGSWPYDAEGWFRPGDLGRVDPATGDIIVTGRVADLINSSGSKVAPSRYETAALSMVPADEIVAFGIPNTLGTEDVGLAVVAPETIDTANLARRMKDRVGDHLDFMVRQFDAIPVGPTGKPDRAALREMFAAKG